MDTLTNLQLVDWSYTMDPARLPPGMVEVARSPADPSGYQGAAVGRLDAEASRRAGSARYGEIVVVNRGTEFTTFADNLSEARRDTLADLKIHIGAREVAQLERAAEFYLSVQKQHGAPSGIRVDVTGHSLGGSCAYFQRAAAIAANLPVADLPRVETFAAMSVERTIERRFPGVTQEAFALSQNHVRRDDNFTGPRAHLGTMPRWGRTTLLPADREAGGFLGEHDTVSLLRYYAAPELGRER